MNQRSRIRRSFAIGWIVSLLLTGAPQISCAQVPTDSIIAKAQQDSVLFEQTFESIIAKAQQDSIKNREVMKDNSDLTKAKPSFKPNPKTAWRTALIFPGFGQFYNQQYWKLPIVYGGLMGCAYAITWNNRTYQDYQKAYFSIMEDFKADPNGEHPENWSENWVVFVPGSADPANYLRNSSFQSALKRGKDNFRRFRDLSIIITIGVYLISVADAYVDAQMFDFDISPDLSFHITPSFTPATCYHARNYGINICMNF